MQSAVRFGRLLLMECQLRTALIAAIKRTDSGALRAEMMLAGRSVAGWQVDLAHALLCERVICLCEGPNDTLTTLQREVEERGGEFHAIRSNLQLVSLVRADDELIMMADGVLADRDAVMQFAAGTNGDAKSALHRGIAVLPAGHSLAASHPEDFERIAGDSHWAGFAVIRAGQVHKLADLPPDGDAMSLLLRLALQASVECRQLADGSADSGDGTARWMIAHSGSAIAEREAALLDSSVSEPSWTGPGLAIAAIATRAIAPRWIEKGPEISALSAVFLTLSGVGLTGYGLPLVGLSLAAFGAFGGAMSAEWSALRSRLWSQDTSARRATMLTIALDCSAAIVLILALGVPISLVANAALPILAIGLAHLAGRDDRASVNAFWRDRGLHLIGFAIASGAGYLNEALSIFAIAALLQLLLRRK